MGGCCRNKECAIILAAFAAIIISKCVCDEDRLNYIGNLLESVGQLIALSGSVQCGCKGPIQNKCCY